MTGISINTRTTVASAAPELKSNNPIAVATASSKKFSAPVKPMVTQCCRLIHGRVPFAKRRKFE